MQPYWDAIQEKTKNVGHLGNPGESTSTQNFCKDFISYWVLKKTKRGCNKGFCCLVGFWKAGILYW